MSIFDNIKAELAKEPKRWLVTGVAGFIGSNLLEALLKVDQQVVGIDNLLTGYSHNLEDVKKTVGAEKWAKFEFIRGDIRDPETAAGHARGSTTFYIRRPSAACRGP